VLPARVSYASAWTPATCGRRRSASRPSSRG